MTFILLSSRKLVGGQNCGLGKAELNNSKKDSAKINKPGFKCNKI